MNAANTDGENTNRKELLAALILAATDQSDALVDYVRQYRTATAKDAVTHGEDVDRFLADRERRPGPRPRKRDA